MDGGADDYDWLILEDFNPEMFEKLLSDIKEDMATNDGECFTSSSSFFDGEPVTLFSDPCSPPPPPPQDPTCEKKRAFYRLEIPYSTYFPRRSMRLAFPRRRVRLGTYFPRRSVRLAKNRNMHFPRRSMRLPFLRRSVRLANNM
nr:MAG: hypothetical protein [Chiromantes dehaani nimavirus]